VGLDEQCRLEKDEISAIYEHPSHINYVAGLMEYFEETIQSDQNARFGTQHRMMISELY